MLSSPNVSCWEDRTGGEPLKPVPIRKKFPSLILLWVEKITSSMVTD